MRVLITGATGFTGGVVARRLVCEGYGVRCFVRSGSDLRRLPDHGVSVAVGDLGRPDTLVRALEGMDALVNVASIGFGHGPGIVHAAETAGVGRAVFFSTTAIFTQLNAASKAVRMSAEAAVTQSRLDWTILRPTMIYGTDRDRNISRLIRFLQRWPVCPVVGDGRRLMQPVYVADLADAVCGVLTAPAGIRKAYNLSGKSPLTFNALIDAVAGALGRRIRRIHLPLKPVVAVQQGLERLGLALPVKAEQVLRLDEDKSFSHEDASADFGYRPMAFQEGVVREIAQMGLIR